MSLLFAVALAAGAAEPCPLDLDRDGTDDPVDDFARWLCVETIATQQALDGDAKAAERRLTRLVQNELPGDDPALGIAYLRLGTSLARRGEVDAARAALDACVRQGSMRGACLDVRGLVDEEAAAIRTVPATWSFQGTVHGVFHPRAYWDKGSIRLKDVDGEGVLVWTTEVDGIEEDALVVTFSSPSPAPREIRLRVRSSDLAAEIEVDLVDDEGRAFAPRPRSFEVPPGDWVQITVNLADAPPLAPRGSPLRPAALARLVLRDATGMTGVSGRNELWIDEIEVR